MDMDVPPRFSSRWDRMAYLADSYKIPITALLLLAGAIIYQSGIPDITIPTWVRPLALGIVYGSLPAYVVGMWIVSKFFPDPREEILELNLDSNGRIVGRSWLVPSDIWEDRQQGERPPLTPDKGASAIVSKLDDLDDVNRIAIEGANPELANPISIVSRQARLEQVEGELLERAEAYDKLEATVRSRALDIQSDNLHALLSAVETGTQMDPSAVSQAFEDDLVSFDNAEADQRENIENGHTNTPDKDIQELIVEGFDNE